MNICDNTTLINSIGTKIIYSFNYNDSCYLNMSNYTILSFYITLTSIILFPSDIISTCLCLIN